jgi:hypothetical protein
MSLVRAGREKKKAAASDDATAFMVVAGTGFEPVTFRL